MPLTKISQNAWHVLDEHGPFLRFRTARDYLTSQEAAGTPVSLPLGHCSPSTAVAVDDCHRCDACLRFRAPSPAHFSEDYLPKIQYAEVGGSLYGCQSVKARLGGLPAVAAPSAWESFRSDSCTSLPCSPLLCSSGKVNSSIWVTPMMPTGDESESPQTVLNETSSALEDTRGRAGETTQSSPDNDGFCLSNVSASIDKLINDSVQRLYKYAPLSPEHQSPIYNLEHATYPRNFQQGPSKTTSEGWAAAATAAAFAAASISRLENTQVGPPVMDMQTELCTGVKLDPGEIYAFLRAKSKTEEVAARIREKVTAAREARRALPQPRLSNVKSAARAPVATALLRTNQQHIYRHSRSPQKSELAPQQKPRGAHQTTKATSSSISKEKATKLLPNRRGSHSLRQRTAEGASAEPIPTEDFIAVGMRMHPRGPAQGPKTLCTPARTVTENSLKNVSGHLSRTIAAGSCKARLASAAFHRPAEKPGLPVSVAASVERSVVSNNSALTRTPSVSEVTPYEKPLTQAVTRNGDSMSPAKTRDPLHVPLAQTNMPENAKRLKAYTAFAPISPISEVPLAKEAAAAEERSSGISAAATPTASTTTAELAVAVKEEPPQVEARLGENQRVGHPATHKTDQHCSLGPVKKVCAAVSREMRLKTTTSKPSLANSQSAALRHLARVICKAISSAAARELRNNAFGFLRRCYSPRYHDSSSAPRCATAAKVRRPHPSKISETRESAPEATSHDYRANDRDMYVCPFAYESCGLLDKVQQCCAAACYKSSCFAGALNRHKGRICESDSNPRALHSNEIGAGPTSVASNTGVRSTLATISTSCDFEHQVICELPQSPHELQRKEVIPAVAATADFQPVPTCPNLARPLHWENASVIFAASDMALTAASTVAMDAAAFQAEKAKNQQRREGLLGPLLEISDDRHQESPCKPTNIMNQADLRLSRVSSRGQEVEPPRKCEAGEPYCTSGTCGRVQPELRQHKRCEPECPRQEERPIQETHCAGHPQELEHGGQQNKLRDLSETLVHRCMTSCSCPPMWHCTANIRLELGGSGIDGHKCYHELIIPVNHHLSRQTLASPPTTFPRHSLRGAWDCMFIPAPAVSSHKFSAPSRLLQQPVCQKLASACPSGGASLALPELLDFNESARQRHTVVSIATTSISESPTTLNQRRNAMNDGYGKFAPSAKASPQAVVSTQSVDAAQSTSEGQQNPMGWADGARPMREHLSELQQLRHQLDSHRQSLTGLFRQVDFSRSKGKSCNNPPLHSLNEESSVELKHDRATRQQKLNYGESLPEVPKTGSISLGGRPKEQQNYEVHERKLKAAVYQDTAGLSGCPLLHTSDRTASPPQQAADFSPPETKAQLLHHQPGQPSSALRQVLWGLLDRMEYVKMKLAPPQRLQTPHVLRKNSQHRPQDREGLSNLPKEPRILKSVIRHRTNSLQPATCQEKRDQFHGQGLTQLRIVGKSMGNAATCSAASYMFKRAAEIPQDVLPFAALPEIRTGSIECRQPNKVTALDTKHREDFAKTLLVVDKSLLSKAYHATTKKNRLECRAAKPRLLLQSKKSAGTAEEECRPKTMEEGRIPEDIGEQGGANQT